MNAYEQMRTAFLVEFGNSMPEATPETINRVADALDRVATKFDIGNKETALSIAEDPIPDLVKTYIIIKKTEGLSNGTLQNYALILRTFFLWCRKSPAEVTANDIRVFLYEYSSHKQVSKWIVKFDANAAKLMLL